LASPWRRRSLGSLLLQLAPRKPLVPSPGLCQLMRHFCRRLPSLPYLFVFLSHPFCLSGYISSSRQTPSDCQSLKDFLLTAAFFCLPLTGSFGRTLPTEGNRLFAIQTFPLLVQKSFFKLPRKVTILPQPPPSASFFSGYHLSEGSSTTGLNATQCRVLS